MAGQEHDGSRRMKTELLIQMDGVIASPEQVIVVKKWSNSGQNGQNGHCGRIVVKQRSCRWTASSPRPSRSPAKRREIAAISSVVKSQRSVWFLSSLYRHYKASNTAAYRYTNIVK